MTDFVFPWEYHFPPFFTLQPNQDTRKAQLSAWRSLFVNYTCHHKIYEMNITDASNHPIFSNRKINRSLTQDGLKVVLDDLEKHGHIEWTDKSKSKFLIHWLSTSQWANVLYDYANQNGLTNTVCTFYELTQSDQAIGTQLHGLNEEILRKAIQDLEKRGKALLISIEASEGVKFL